MRDWLVLHVIPCLPTVTTAPPLGLYQMRAVSQQGIRCCLISCFDFIQAPASLALPSLILCQTRNEQLWCHNLSSGW